MSHLLYAGYVLLVAVTHLPVLRDLVTVSMASPEASHVVLIPFLAAALVYRSRNLIFVTERTPRPSTIVTAILGIAILTTREAFGGSGTSLSIQVFAMVSLWVAGFVWCYGLKASRAAIFPLAFLILTVPIPEPVLNAAVSFLKRGSTETVAWLFTLIGTPYHREDFTFSLATITIEVGDECSGIRSSLALVLLSLLAGRLFLTSGWKRAFLVMVVLPIAIFKNAIRIVTLSLLAIHVDPSFLTGYLHQEGGVVFFLLAMGLLMPILGGLRRSEPASASPSLGVQPASL